MSEFYTNVRVIGDSILDRGVQNGKKINYKEDGINSMDYEFLSIDTIYDRHKLINVKTKGYGL